MSTCSFTFQQAANTTMSWRMNRLVLLVLLPAIFLLLPNTVMATDATVITCGDTGCAPGNISMPEDMVWAPGSSVHKTIKIINDSPAQKQVLSGWSSATSTGDAGQAVLVSWENGAHKLLWQGSADQVTQVALGTIPSHASRNYILTVWLPDTTGNGIRGSLFLQPWLKLTEILPKTTAQTEGDKKINTDVLTKISSQVLGQSAAAFLLPELNHAGLLPVASAQGDSPVAQIAQSVRQQAWIAWILLGLEIIALKPWLNRTLRWMEGSLAGIISAVAIWLVSGSWMLSGMAVIIAIMWLGLKTLLTSGANAAGQ